MDWLTSSILRSTAITLVRPAAQPDQVIGGQPGPDVLVGGEHRGAFPGRHVDGSHLLGEVASLRGEGCPPVALGREGVLVSRDIPYSVATFSAVTPMWQ